jgi:Ca2+-binding EF-hand superfamily protein
MKKLTNSTTFKGTLILVAFLATQNQSFAQDRNQGPPSFAQILAELDKDEDGKLSESEVKGPLKNDFSKIDSNEDGFISETEFNEAPKPKGKPRGKK